VPCSVINTIEEVFNDPQVNARKMKIELPHPVAGTIPGVSNPLKFSVTEVEYRKAPPVHGADTEDVLGNILGYSATQVEDLKISKVI
jgi:crotonobetainyl-CoA:carnitine CoA-transferase CaiB-like acyl-CoA transferase